MSSQPKNKQSDNLQLSFHSRDENNNSAELEIVDLTMIDIVKISQLLSVNHSNLQFNSLNENIFWRHDHQYSSAISRFRNEQTLISKPKLVTSNNLELLTLVSKKPSVIPSAFTQSSPWKSLHSLVFTNMFDYSWWIHFVKVNHFQWDCSIFSKSSNQFRTSF